MADKRFPTEKVVIDNVGEISGEKYSGVFIVKTLLSHGSYLEQDRIRRQLAGPEGGRLDEDAVLRARMFSVIAVHVVEAPGWWTAANEEGVDGLGIPDDVVIAQIYEGVMKHDKRHQKELADREKAAQEALKAAAAEEQATGDKTGV